MNRALSLDVIAKYTLTEIIMDPISMAIGVRKFFTLFLDYVFLYWFRIKIIMYVIMKAKIKFSKLSSPKDQYLDLNI